MTSRLKSVALAAVALGSLLASTKPSDAAQLFSKAEVPLNKLVAVAAPYSNGTAHQLLVIEQLSNARSCWSEIPNGNMTTIDPLLVQFDFTGICGRSIDSNGYSIRMGDEDLGLKYSVRVVKRGGDMLLIGAPAIDKKLPELQIGHVNGITNGFAKINFNPGWRMTKRVYNGNTMGHIYLTNDQSLASAIATLPTQPAPSQPSQPGVTLPTPKPTVPVLTPRPTVPVLTPRPTGPILTPKPPVAGTPAPAIPIVVPKPGGSVSVGNPGSRPITQPPVLPSPIGTPPSGNVSSPSKPNPTQPNSSQPKPGDFVVPTIDVYP